MITLDRDLPTGALLPSPPVPAQETVAALGGVWYAPGGAVLEGGGVTRIAALAGGKVAEPVDGNDGALKLGGTGPARHFQFRSREACGFAAPLPGAPSMLSLAILFCAEADPGRTLAAVTPVDGRDYIFLSHEEGAVTLAKRKAPARISCPIPAGVGVTLVLAHAASSAWMLALNDGPPQRIDTAPAFVPGAYDLFIGCRRRRAGLQSALGAAKIFDVIAMPDVDVFSPSAAPLSDALVARWEEVARHVV
ncbi:MAG: hypothetical protein AAF771_03755 [Pseudomonadota bacterium]